MMRVNHPQGPQGVQNKKRHGKDLGGVEVNKNISNNKLTKKFTFLSIKILSFTTFEPISANALEADGQKKNQVETRKTSSV